MAAAKELSPEKMKELEVAFRAGLMSWRNMSNTFGVGMAWIKKTSERLGWQRDLDQKIKSEAKRRDQEAIARESAKEEKKRNPDYKLTEREVTEQNVEAITLVTGSHRAALARTRAMAQSLLDELEFAGANRELLDGIASELAAGKDDRRADLIAKLSSTQGRTAAFKQVVESLKTIITTEREILRITEDESKSSEAAFGTFIKRVMGTSFKPVQENAASD